MESGARRVKDILIIADSEERINTKPRRNEEENNKKNAIPACAGMTGKGKENFVPSLLRVYSFFRRGWDDIHGHLWQSAEKTFVLSFRGEAEE